MSSRIWVIEISYFFFAWMWWGKKLWLFNKNVQITSNITFEPDFYCNRLVNTNLCVFPSACGQIWGQLRMTFCLQVALWLRSRAPVHLASRHVHKLSSLRKATSLPPKKMQSLLYPFSGLEAYLDRCSDEIQPKLSAGGCLLISWSHFSGQWTGCSFSCFIPLWRTWWRRRSSSVLHRLTGSITTSLQRGWTTLPLWNSQRLARRLSVFNCINL